MYILSDIHFKEPIEMFVEPLTPSLIMYISCNFSAESRLLFGQKNKAVLTPSVTSL